MDWSIPLSTLLGAFLGVGATLVADRARWRRESQQRRTDLRREVYADYLAALHRANDALRALSLSDPPEAGRASAAREAFRGGGVQAAREQVALTAPAAVVQAADTAFGSQRALRDLVAAGVPASHPDYAAALDTHIGALDRLRNAMRADLGEPPLSVELTM